METHICSTITCFCGCEYCTFCYNGCPQCGRGRMEIKNSSSTSNLSEETLEKASKDLRLLKKEAQEYNLKRIEKILEKYMFYSGEWHNIDCSFVFYDTGVCECDYKKNRESVKKALNFN